ncbi:YqzH family protein [Neobacillus sp. SCS-31]|uniref:YqzH family protein n=1 Tax=Neobacillus oceani TaxID=3115292 RepID=UPI0039062690
MDEKLVKKMIKNCLKQYYGEESQPLGERDVNDICERVYRLKEAEPEAHMRDIVNDVVYEFLTG